MVPQHRRESSAQDPLVARDSSFSRASFSAFSFSSLSIFFLFKVIKIIVAINNEIITKGLIRIKYKPTELSGNFCLNSK